MWRGLIGDQGRKEMLNCVDTGKVEWREGEVCGTTRQIWLINCGRQDSTHLDDHCTAGRETCFWFCSCCHSWSRNSLSSATFSSNKTPISSYELERIGKGKMRKPEAARL